MLKLTGFNKRKKYNILKKQSPNISTSPITPHGWDQFYNFHVHSVKIITCKK
uniref:Uncharacterized protein n=1 Tax=Rhizophora mucronata TaxID=61149 RepID=A0A2P2QHC0_RHIMU